MKVTAIALEAIINPSTGQVIAAKGDTVSNKMFQYCQSIGIVYIPVMIQLP